MTHKKLLFISLLLIINIKAFGNMEDILIHLDNGIIKSFKVADISKITFDLETTSKNKQTFDFQKNLLNNFNGIHTINDGKTLLIYWKNLPQNSITLKIFNLKGLCIKTVDLDQKKNMTKTFVWDLKNSEGTHVPCGRYIVTVESDNKIILKNHITVY